MRVEVWTDTRARTHTHAHTTVTDTFCNHIATCHCKIDLFQSASLGAAVHRDVRAGSLCVQLLLTYDSTNFNRATARTMEALTAVEGSKVVLSLHCCSSGRDLLDS